MVCSLFIASCQSQAQGPNQGVYERLISDDCAQKPWVNNPPEADSQYLYFVGKSVRQATERNARQDAMVNATEQFVNFTGIEVSIFDQFLQVSYGLSSKVQDPTLSQRRKSEMRANAFVSRLKAKEFCNERYQKMSGDRAVGGRIYLTTVLMKVPLGEVENVKKWMAQHQQQALDKLRAQRDSLLKAANDFRSAGVRAERRGLLIAALENLHSAGLKLKQAATVDPKGQLTRFPPPPAPTAADLLALESRMASGLTLTGKNTVITVEPGEVGPDLVVEASYRGGKRPVPVGGLPLLFMAGNKLLRQAQTDPNGIARMPMQAINRQGRLSFTALVARGNLRDKVSQTTMEALARLRVEFRVEVRPKSMEEKAKDLVSSLEKDVRGRHYSLVVENFTFGDTKTAGPFINRFKEAIKTALVKSPKFEVKAPVSRRGLTRGYKVVSSDSPAALAHASNSQGVLFGNYDNQGDRVLVRANLKDRRDRLVASSAVSISKSTIPPGLSLLPANFGQVTAAASALGDPGAGADFRLDLWIDKGSGGTYREGEKLYVNVRAEVDCYVKLVYVVAGGQRLVIFPNAFDRNTRIRKGKVYQIPNKRSDFDFVIEPPFGSEMLIAFASTRPLPPDEGRKIGGGMVELSESLSVIARKHRRGIGVNKRKARFAEKRVTLTTQPRSS